MRSWSRCPSAIGVLIAALGALWPPAVAAQGPPSLFVEPTSAPDARRSVSPDTARARRLAVRIDVLTAALLPTAPRHAPLGLNLFDDVTLSIDREHLEADRHGAVSWVGAVSGDPSSTVALTWNGAYLVGGVVTRGMAYDLASDASGAVVVRERAPLPAIDERAPRWPASRDMLGVSDLTAPPAAASTVDVLVVYTAAARVKAGGTSAMMAAIANAVAVTNTALQRSGVSAVIREVGSVEGSYREGALGGNDLGVDLDVMSPGGIGSAAVEAARAASGADLVTLITGRDRPTACGIAWVGPSPLAAYSVTEQECLRAGQWSFSHELAHNFGAGHAPGDDGSSTPPPVPYAQGYRSGAVRTLMAYAGPGPYYPRILNYSSEAVREPADTGLPTGNSLQNNARRLAETAPTLAAYKSAAATAPPTPGAFAASVAGTTVTLSWTPPGIGGAILSFDLEAGPAPGSAAFGRASFTQSPAVLANVPPGTYYLRLRSRGPGGESAPTADVMAAVAAGCVAPGAPSLAATVRAGVVSLSWSASAGSDPVAYYLGVGTAPGSDDLGVYPAGAATGVTVAPPRGTYYVRVVGTNACGPGPVSAPVAVTIP